jgi:hypothetical protein
MGTSTERVRKMRERKYKIEANLDELDQGVLVSIRELSGDLPDATIIRRALLAYQRELMRAQIEAL